MHAMIVTIVSVASAAEPAPWATFGTWSAAGAANGADVAHGVTFVGERAVVAVGSMSRDGAGEDGGQDAFVVWLELSAGELTPVWEHRWDTLASEGPHRGDDRSAAFDVVGTAQGDLAICGRWGGAADSLPSGGAGAHWLLLSDSAISPASVEEPTWSWTRTASQDSLDGACRAVATVGDDFLTAGSAIEPYGSRWWMHRGSLADPDSASEETWPIQASGAPITALDVAVHPTSGDYVVAGEGPGQTPDDTDAYVQYYDSDGTLLWTARSGGATSDRAVSVAFSGDGAVMAGLFDSASPLSYGAPLGRVARLDALGDGLGGAVEDWSFAIGGEHPVVAESNGTLFVVRSSKYATGPWSLFRFDSTTGAGPTTLWNSDFFSGDGVAIRDVAKRGELMAIAGSTPGPDGSADFTVTLIGEDRDRDGVANVIDGCPDDEAKTSPGLCGCGLPDTGDQDDDGTPDCLDRCANDPEKSEDAGVCGCGVSDRDADLDGVADCNDECPSSPFKVQPGECGCDVEVTDADSDGVVDCQDRCPAEPGGPEDGCAEGTSEGCRCTHGGGPGPFACSLLFIVVLQARRRWRERASEQAGQPAQGPGYDGRP